MYLSEGDLVAGRYRIRSKVARGGMGMIYDAMQENLDRRVALKMILPTLINNPQSARRFQREIEIAQTLSHRNIVEIYDYGKEDDVFWVAMEFLEGSDLSTYLMASGPLPLGKVLAFTRQTLQALSIAHRRGIVHRDIKAPNVFVEQLASGEEVVKLLDFGVAKSLDDESGLTGTGNVCGSTAYMAPEMLLYGEVSLSVDVYALGLLMVEMLVAKRAVSGSSIGEHVMLQSNGVIRLPEPFAGTSVEKLIRRACAKQPEDRFQTASEMLEALERLEPAEAPDARIPTRLADAFEFSVPDKPLPYERTGSSQSRIPEPEPIKMAADTDDLTPDPSIALEAAGGYDPGIYFEASDSGSSVGLKSDTESSGSHGSATEAEAPAFEAATKAAEVWPEPTQPVPFARAARKIAFWTAVGGLITFVCTMVILGAFGVLTPQPRWSSGDALLEAMKDAGWTISPGQIEESRERKVQRWLAFKGSRSTRLEIFECQPLSRCEPDAGGGVVIEGDGFWIRTSPGPGGPSAEFEAWRSRLEAGPGRPE